MEVTLTMTGMRELYADLARIAGSVAAGKTAVKALEKAAQPIENQIRVNATTKIKVRSHALLDSISAGKVTQSDKYGYQIKIGAQAPHARLVEKGHGGPHPAGKHPFVQPAFDAKKEEAYGIIKKSLNDAINRYGG